ncbi:hypothetical protein JIX56_13290 [Streptomyces sp. CA-210063]|uniref:hypothetical protein n=1 Tax=Streptomyces sp. CA-210063 TaxID=2801029 RepID=UPI00214CC354|nr:hypothetical protein [Streptomyces sp. CA-210063]UUU30803.1 hypothetical protein JIX56_13290 [Streptomyces sp. CA-210063]
MSEPDTSPALAEQFKESRGQPIRYNDVLVYMAYRVPVDTTLSGFQVEFLESMGSPVQGVCVQLDKGNLVVEGSVNPGLVLWADSAPPVVQVAVDAENGANLQIWNCWRGRFGERAAWLVNSGMVCEVLHRDEFIFSCSSGPGGVNFSDLKFRLKLDR